MEDHFKINIDASIFQNKGSGLGKIIRNFETLVMATATCQITGLLEPVEAKAQAMINGLEICREMGVDQLYVELDCLELVMALSSKEDDLSSPVCWWSTLRTYLLFLKMWFFLIGPGLLTM